MAGGHGQGDALNQLHFPFGFDIDDDGSLFIADMNNHRIVRWKSDATQGEIIAGARGGGYRADQLNQPLIVLIDRMNDCVIISDYRNRRVVRWFLQKNKQPNDDGEVILSGILSFGLAMDNEGSLYVSDWERHQVRRHGREDGRNGVVVAGGNGDGAALNQLHHPLQILVGTDRAVYVSDSYNHRVMKWTRDAKNGMVVAGGQGQGNSLAQLSYPCGIFVDPMGSVYVADQFNHRVMRWVKDAKKGEVIVSGNSLSVQSNQFHQPTSISLDQRGNLYVVDRNNHRIQCFEFQ